MNIDCSAAFENSNCTNLKCACNPGYYVNTGLDACIKSKCIIIYKSAKKNFYVNVVVSFSFSFLFILNNILSKSLNSIDFKKEENLGTVFTPNSLPFQEK